MRETKQFLIERWEFDFKGIGETITNHLRDSKGLETLSLPTTVNNRIDLRGYTTPKKYLEEKSNSGNLRKYVGESLKIKNVKLSNLDFSLANFERCFFINCDFSNSKFDETRFVACNFWGCLFQGSEFLKTNFGYSTFSTDGIIFRKRKINFLNNKFKAVNFSEVRFSEQIIIDSIFTDCRFGASTFSHCEMKNLDFQGEVKNLFIIKNKNAHSVNFTNSELIDLQMRDTTNEGFIFKSTV